MGIREQRDMGSMDVYEEMRDEYLTGKIWNVGDTIKANGKVGEIVRKGTNYVSYVTEDGKVHKAWLHHIELKKGTIGKNTIIIILNQNKLKEGPLVIKPVE